MHLSIEQCRWLSQKGVIVLEYRGNFQVISPVQDVSILRTRGDEIAPVLPDWVLDAAFTTRVEGTSNQLSAIKEMSDLIRSASMDFFDSPWMFGIDLITFDIAIAEEAEQDPEQSHALGSAIDKTLCEVVNGSETQPGLSKLALDGGGWFTWEGWVPMLHWLLGRYTAESVLPQIFAKALL